MEPPLPILNQGTDQGADEHVRPANGALPIAETFVSLQGEGKLSGVPSWFCRASGCNLRCAWCDTPYASWKPEGNARQVEALIAEGLTTGVRHAVLTGGEPMLFAALVDLAAGLRAGGMHVTIETAGTIDLPAPADLLSISPKLSTSTPSTQRSIDLAGTPAWSARHEARRINLPALQSLLNRPCDRQLKFVACTPADVPEIEGLLTKLTGWSPADVLLMPEGVVQPSAEHLAWVAQACVQRGWRFCPRLHIQLYGNKRGT